MYMAHENPKDQKVLICKHNIACIPSDFIDLSHTLAITRHNGRKSQRSALIGPNPFPISHSGAKGAVALISFNCRAVLLWILHFEPYADYSWLLHKAGLIE